MTSESKFKEKTKRLKNFYENIASTKKYATSLDINLRELEITGIQKYLKDRMRVLDVGCGNGYSTYNHAEKFKIQVVGLDYSRKMIQNAKKMPHRRLEGKIDFICGNILKIPFPNNHFDIVISTRCLMALLDWNLQKKALIEIARVLKPGGKLLLQEGTFQGLERLNKMREKFGLSVIPVCDNKWPTLKLDEKELLSFNKDHYRLIKIHRFGMYYFISRIIHPLLVYPKTPKNEAKINFIARQVALKIPNYKGLGHLVFFVFQKRRVK